MFIVLSTGLYLFIRHGFFIIVITGIIKFDLKDGR